MVRGLTIDKQRGNILKIDRHKYVKIAYHGFRELSRAERRAIYSDSNVSQCILMLHRATLHVASELQHPRVRGMRWALRVQVVLQHRSIFHSRNRNVHLR